MSNCCFCNFIKRSFLYQILIIIASLKLKDAFRYNRAFVQRIVDFLTSINLSEKWVEYLPRNKEYTHKGFLITLIVLASFSILNLSFFKILSAIGCILLGFLYHNPIPNIKNLISKKVPCTWVTLEENLPEMEFIIYMCLAFGMLANAFSCSTCNKDTKKEEKEEKEKKEEEKDIPINKEEKKEMPKSKKEKKEANKNNSNKNNTNKNVSKKNKKKKE